MIVCHSEREESRRCGQITYDGTTSSITDHKVLIRLQFVQVSEVCAVNSGCFRFARRWRTEDGRQQVQYKRQSSVGRRVQQGNMAYVIILRRSLQSLSPALADWTRPAEIAASRIIWQPMASHAAGTVSHTSAAPWQDKYSKWKKGSKRLNPIGNAGWLYTPRSATAPISRVICCLAYSQIQERKSMIKSLAFLPGWTQGRQKRVISRISLQPPNLLSKDSGRLLGYEYLQVTRAGGDLPRRHREAPSALGII